jgi:hypothetical protein
MRALITVVALCGFAAMAHATPPLDPLAPARDGMTACHSPDTKSRTCSVIYAYAFNADGTVMMVSTSSLSPNLIMRARRTVRVRDGMVCGQEQPSDLESTTFEFDGAPLSPERTQALRGDLLAATPSSRFGEVCLIYSQTGDTVSVASQLNGRPWPNVSEMIWVRPSDGYVLRAP